MKLQHYFKAGHLLQQCCLSNISTVMDYRHVISTIDIYKDMYEYFRHQSATELQGCSLAAAVLFASYLNNYEQQTYQ